MKGSTITFALVREGPTDDGLVRLIREVIIACVDDGAVVIGEPRDYKGRPASQVIAVRDETGPDVDLLFVHHDSDARDDSGVVSEIAAAAQEFPRPDSVVAVIPVQETEAWLLADEELIQSVVGRAKTTMSRRDLGIPALDQVENTASPKEVLEQALVAATKESGRARKRTKSKFSDLRTAIMDFLDIDGPLAELPSWRRFRESTESAVANL